MDEAMEVSKLRVPEKVYVEIRQSPAVDIPPKGFWVLRTTKLRTVFAKWKALGSKKRKTADVVFMFRGQPLDPSATVCESSLQNCDIIDVMSETHVFRLGKVEEGIGYRFRNKHLGIIALSDNLPMRKLAQIGDRVLDVAVYLFMKRTPSYESQSCLTTHLAKKALVSNVPLRDIFTNLGLDKFVVFIKRKRDSKVYPDMVEALLGAVYMDAGYKIEAVQRVIARLRLGVFAKLFVDPTKAKSIIGEEKEESGSYAPELQDFLETRRQLQTKRHRQFFDQLVAVMESYRQTT